MSLHFLLQCKIRKLLKIRKMYQSTGFIFDYCNYRSEQIKLQTAHIITVNQCVNKLGVFYLHLSSNNGGNTICNKMQWKWKRKQGVPACNWCYMQGHRIHGFYRQHQRKHSMFLASSNLCHTLRKFRKTKGSNMSNTWWGR